jgi:hypothetical protein
MLQKTFDGCLYSEELLIVSRTNYNTVTLVKSGLKMLAVVKIAAHQFSVTFAPGLPIKRRVKPRIELTQKRLCNCDSHGRDYEEYSLLECDVV